MVCNLVGNKELLFSVTQNVWLSSVDANSVENFQGRQNSIRSSYNNITKIHFEDERLIFGPHFAIFDPSETRADEMANESHARKMMITVIIHFCQFIPTYCDA